MPSGMTNIDQRFPQFKGSETQEQKLRIILDYLFMLREYLQYVLNNLSPDNFNATALDGLIDEIRAGVVVAETMISNTVITNNLYAEYGDISELTVDRLSSLNKVEKFWAGDTSEVNYIKVQDQTYRAVTGTTDGSTVQLTDRYGNLLYYKGPVTAGTYKTVGMSAAPTAYPVIVYDYDELVKMTIGHVYDEDSGYWLPQIIMGAGDGVLAHSAKSIITKVTDGLEINYYAANTGDLRQIKLGNTGITMTPSAGGGKKYGSVVIGTTASGHTASDCDYLCDGVDDQVQFNAAIAYLENDSPIYGGSIIILAGDYHISGTIMIDYTSSLKIIGAGIATAIYDDREYVETFDYTNSMIYISYGQLTISDLYLEGQIGIWTYGYEQTIERCHFRGDYGIYSEYMSKTTVSNCTFTDNLYSIYFADGGYKNRIINCFFYNFSGDSYYIYSLGWNSTLTISGCISVYTGKFIYATESFGWTVINNVGFVDMYFLLDNDSRISNNRCGGTLTIENAHDTTIDGNQMEGGDYDAIRIIDSVNVGVANNTIAAGSNYPAGWLGTGIYASGSDMLRIENNSVKYDYGQAEAYGTGAYNIHLLNCTNSIVMGNLITGGIAVYDETGTNNMIEHNHAVIGTA